MFTFIIFVRLFTRLLLGSILLSVSASKLAYPNRFREGILDYQLLPSILTSKMTLPILLSFGIPLAELAAALGLISGFLLIPATTLALSLLLLFSGAIGINLLRGRRDLSCHCTGAPESHPISWWLIGRNSLFIMGLFVLLFTSPDMLTVSTLLRSPSSFSNAVWFGTVLPTVVLVSIILCTLLLLNHIRVLWHP